MGDILEKFMGEMVGGYYDVRCLGGYGDAWKEVKGKGGHQLPSLLSLALTYCI